MSCKVGLFESVSIFPGSKREFRKDLRDRVFPCGTFEIIIAL